MVRGRWLGIIIGLFGTFMLCGGVARYLRHPEPGDSLLPIGILAILIGIQDLSRTTAREARFWMSIALSLLFGTYGLLQLAAEEPDVFWAFLAFAGLLTVTLSIFLSRGRWMKLGGK